MAAQVEKWARWRLLEALESAGSDVRVWPVEVPPGFDGEAVTYARLSTPRGGTTRQEDGTVFVRLVFKVHSRDYHRAKDIALLVAPVFDNKKYEEQTPDGDKYDVRRTAIENEYDDPEPPMFNDGASYHCVTLEVALQTKGT